MSSPANLDWLYHTLGWTLAAAGVALLAWALFWDRSRGRRRCPKCWYSMEGVPGLRCPECGREAARESRLFRTHRRWRVASLSLLVMCGGHALYLVPAVQHRGWWGAVPNLIVIAGLPKAGTEWSWDQKNRRGLEDLFSAEMNRRVDDDRIRAWEMRWAFDRIGLLRTRESWSADEAVRVGIWVPRWLNGVITATPEGEGLIRIEQKTGRSISGTFHEVYEAEERDQSIGVLRPGYHRLVFDIEVAPGMMAAIKGRGKQVIRSRVTLHTTVVGLDQEIIRGISNGRLDTAAGRAVHVDVSKWNGVSGPTPYRYLSVYVDRSKAPELDGIALGVAIDILHNGELVRSIPCDRMTRANFTPPYTLRDVRELPELHAKTFQEADAPNWSIRVRGSSWASLREYDCDRYWNGEFTVPMTQVLSR